MQLRRGVYWCEKTYRVDLAIEYSRRMCRKADLEGYDL